MDSGDEGRDVACNNYRIDMEGENFGDCRCGFDKASHFTKKGESKARQALLSLRKDSGDDDLGKQDEPCNNYRVNLTADEFGLCKCGWKKEQHTKKGKNVAAKALEQLKQRKHSSFSGNMTGDEPCEKFRLDVSADEFNICKNCGFKGADHGSKNPNRASEALRNLRNRNAEKNKEADLLAYADRETVEKKMRDKKKQMMDSERKLNGSAPAVEDESKSTKPVKPVKPAKGDDGCCIIC